MGDLSWWAYLLLGFAAAAGLVLLYAAGFVIGQEAEREDWHRLIRNGQLPSPQEWAGHAEELARARAYDNAVLTNKNRFLRD